MGPHPRFEKVITSFWAIASVFVWAIAGFAAADSPARHRVTVDEHPFAVWSKTAENPRAVMLLIHGRTWSTLPDFDLQVAGEDLSLMDGLVEMGISVYGLDLRGYGGTPRDASDWLTPDVAQADVAGVLDWVQARHPDLGRPYLFGWSMGSMVAQLVAQRHGEKLQGLILFGYPIRPGMEATADSVEPLKAATTAEAAASDFIVPGTISQQAIEAFVAGALAADPVRTDWRGMGQWQALDPAAVARPTLLLQAEHDPLAVPEVHSEFFARLGTSDKAWVVIPGGDHAAFMETPRPYFLSAINSFLFRAVDSAIP